MHVPLAHRKYGNHHQLGILFDMCMAGCLPVFGFKASALLDAIQAMPRIGP